MAVILRATAAEVSTVARVVERNSQVDVDLYGQIFPCPYYSRRSRANRGICLCGLRAIGRSWWRLPIRQGRGYRNCHGQRQT
jgi:hypothetical protein